MRSHPRHQTNIPVHLNYEQMTKTHDSELINVSLGGLSFLLPEPASIGDEVEVFLKLVDPPTKIIGHIMWCKRFANHFQVGLKFSRDEDPFLTRMVDQICRIEDYRLQTMETRGVEMSSEEAAAEWISKYAKEYSHYN